MKHPPDFLINQGKDSHHGEGHIRDMNNDNFLDIIHSTREWLSWCPCSNKRWWL